MSATSQSLYPLQFQPLFRSYIWGGRGLKDYLGKPIADEGVWAESWEIVDHGPDQSIITNGPLAGKTLGDLIDSDPIGLLGHKLVQAQLGAPIPQPRHYFPLLLKYLDCNNVLSVQVHPDDAYGLKMPKPDLGKTEAWYVVHAEPDAIIYAGLRAGVTRNHLAEAIAAGRTEDCLHQVPARSGDCIFIPAGTVHALGSGLIVAEIQQSSDTTFRLFDWNRVDKEGNSRPLHIEQALKVIDFNRGPVEPQALSPRQTPSPLSPRWDSLVECSKFTIDRLSGAGTFHFEPDERFALVTVPRGHGRIDWAAGSIDLKRGDSVLIPAASPAVVWETTASDAVLLFAKV
jgi:mannose-6-phosphate isomerase